MQLTNASALRGHQLMLPENLTVANAVRRHLTMKPKLRKHYAGFYYKENDEDDGVVEVRFLFGRVEFVHEVGFVSYQAHT